MNIVKKKPPFLPLSPFLAMPAKKLGRAALQKGKEGKQAADPSFCLHGEKKWAHLAKAATVNAGL